MTETILIIIFAIVLFGGYFLLRKVPKPASSYIKILMAIGILILIWFDWDEKNRAPQYILTALAVANIIMSFFELRKARKKVHL